MLKVALTGGIATGKSHVLQALRKRGIPCLDADSLAHDVMAAGTETSHAIAARFGDVLTPDGAVDRQKLGPIVFGDDEARRALEAIVHPAVYRAIEAGLRAFELTDRPALAVVDIPLLYETGRAGEFDWVIATVCSEAHQRERLRARGLTEAQIDQRLAAQLPAAEKARRADIVISTDGTFAETNVQVGAAIERLQAAPRPSRSR
ncbi:MAG: dephospho-CoA kinase [Acidimicrobiia bacterium]|nr:dephospho-CoA kinase [Acidimicrobiia bacterium]